MYDADVFRGEVLLANFKILSRHIFYGWCGMDYLNIPLHLLNIEWNEMGKQ
jgi:hypothetical protein